MSKAKEIVTEGTLHWAAQSVVAAEQVVALERIAAALEKCAKLLDPITVIGTDDKPEPIHLNKMGNKRGKV